MEPDRRKSSRTFVSLVREAGRSRGMCKPNRLKVWQRGRLIAASQLKAPFGGKAYIDSKKKTSAGPRYALNMHDPSHKVCNKVPLYIQYTLHNADIATSKVGETIPIWSRGARKLYCRCIS